MRRALAATAIIVLAGCGSSEPETPAGCLAPAQRYLDALEAAPAAVRLAGDTAISECLTPDQDPAAQNEVGGSVVKAATDLNRRARRNPQGSATVELGYLVGAVQRGASDTGGIHADLVRRLDAAARFTPRGGTPPVAFERAFGRGYAAGQESG